MHLQSHTAYRLAAGLALVTALLIVWLNVAAGLMGSCCFGMPPGSGFRAQKPQVREIDQWRSYLRRPQAIHSVNAAEGPA